MLSKFLLFFTLVLKLVKDLPKEYRFELGSQIIRAALSNILNIAEGSGKSSDKELNRFMGISLGSVNETLAVIDILKGNGLIDEKAFSEIYNKLFSISNQLGGFKKKIKVVSHQLLVVSQAINV